MAKYCSKCGKKLSENDIFCSKCGTRVEIQDDNIEVVPLEEEKNKETFHIEEYSAEKRGVIAKLENIFKARERSEKEKQEIIQKSTLQREQLIDLESYPTSDIKVKKYKEFRKFKEKTILEFAFAIVGMVLFVALCFVVKYINIADTVKVISLLLGFIGIFACFAFICDRFYRINCIKYLEINKKGIKKISYGKPPLMLHKGILYSVEGDKCKNCGSTVHIEELDDIEVIVCDNDRTHIARIDFDELDEKVNRI